MDVKRTKVTDYYGNRLREQVRTGTIAFTAATFVRRYSKDTEIVKRKGNARTPTYCKISTNEQRRNDGEANDFA